MCEQMPHGDGGMRITTEVTLHGSVQLDLSLLDEKHDRRSRGNHLREGCRVKDRILSHDLLHWHERTMALRPVSLLAATGHPQHCTRRLPCLDRCGECGLNRCNAGLLGGK